MGENADGLGVIIALAVALVWAAVRIWTRFFGLRCDDVWHLHQTLLEGTTCPSCGGDWKEHDYEDDL